MRLSPRQELHCRKREYKERCDKWTYSISFCPRVREKGITSWVIHRIRSLFSHSPINSFLPLKRGQFKAFLHTRIHCFLSFLLSQQSYRMPLLLNPFSYLSLPPPLSSSFPSWLLFLIRLPFVSSPSFSLIILNYSYSMDFDALLNSFLEVIPSLFIPSVLHS